jgi:hypothetical protein
MKHWTLRYFIFKIQQSFLSINYISTRHRPESISWMLEPGFLAVVRYLAPLPSPLPSPNSKLDRRHTGRLRKRENLLTGEAVLWTRIRMFWASWIRIRILLWSSKKSKKISIPSVFWLVYDFFISEKDVNVQDPNLLVKGMEPWTRIHTKMSRIRNTVERGGGRSQITRRRESLGLFIIHWILPGIAPTLEELLHRAGSGIPLLEQEHRS